MIPSTSRSREFPGAVHRRSGARSLVRDKAEPFAERIAALRAAFEEMVQDPLFIMQAERAGAELDPTPGVEVQK